MSVYCVWGELDRSIVMYLEGNWTWQEYDAAEQAMFQMIDALGESVIAIADLTNVGKSPKGTIQRGVKMMENYHPMIKTTIIVGNSPIIRMMIKVLKRIFSAHHPVQKFMIVATMPEAYQVIKETYYDKFLAKND